MSNEELAKIISCSTVTLDKMSKYARVSKSQSNLKLVLAIVSRYRSSSIPNSELIAEGTRGLAKAVLRFDHSKGVRCNPSLI
jgi:DNA-directed RNA polymerase sigma subunit (sigma70/sigma32)